MLEAFKNPAKIVVFRGFSKTHLLGLQKKPMFSGFQLSDKPTPTIFLKSGIASILVFLGVFQNAHVGGSSGESNVLWYSAYPYDCVEICSTTRLPRACHMHMLGTLKNPLFCSSQLSDKPTVGQPLRFLEIWLCRNTRFPRFSKSFVLW